MSSESTIESLGSNLYTDSTGHTIEDYPGEIDNEYLLGIDESGGWYFNPNKINVMNYQLEGGEGGKPLELKLQFSMDEDEFKDSFTDVSELAGDLVDRTVLGHAFVLSSELAEKTHFSEPQAKVYSLREIYDVGRTQTSRILNKSPNTIDNQRESAKRKAEKAKSFIKILREYAPDET
jgi:hypothetical protein